MSMSFASAQSTYTPWPFATRKRAEIRLAELALELTRLDRRGAPVLHGCLCSATMTGALCRQVVESILDAAGFSKGEIEMHLDLIENPPS